MMKSLIETSKQN